MKTCRQCNNSASDGESNSHIRCLVASHDETADIRSGLIGECNSFAPKESSASLAGYIDEKLSSGDICLNKTNGAMLTIRKDKLIPLIDGMYQVQITLEHRAWECPFCGKSQEYYLVNGNVVLGSGGHTQVSNRKISNSCSDCFQKSDEWHKST